MVALSQSYSYTVRDKILSGPPPAFQQGRRRSSSFLEFVGKRVSLCHLVQHYISLEQLLVVVKYF